MKTTEYMQIDERSWPRVRCTLADAPVSDEALFRTVALLGAIARRGERYTLLIDARSAQPLGARQRKLVADLSVPTAAYAARNCAGSAIVVSNGVLVGVLTALHWLKPTGYPEKAFDSVSAAEQWLEARERSAS